MSGMCETAVAMMTAENVWIYGSGITGSRAAAELGRMNCLSKVRGFVVTHKSGVDSIEGFPVYGIEELDEPDKDALFLLALSEKYHAEVIDTLKSKGYSNYATWNSGMRWYLTDYGFEDRRKNRSKVCFVLSGYKEFLWERIFERLIKFLPSDVEVCILSSGLYNKELGITAEKNGWSYLHTAINCLTLVQNMGVCLFDRARWIYKMDEDIFLTEGCFDKLFDTYLKVEENEPYNVGFTAPLMPLNGYSYIHILSHYGRIEDYERRFGKAVFGGSTEREIEKNPDVAAYMWGEGGMPLIDDMNREFGKEWGFGVCGVRYSIGFILYNRAFWELMDGFTMTGGIDLGADERELCSKCIIKSKAMIVSHDTVTGHFAFGPQTEAMKGFYRENPGRFALNRE